MANNGIVQKIIGTFTYGNDDDYDENEYYEEDYEDEEVEEAPEKEKKSRFKFFSKKIKKQGKKRKILMKNQLLVPRILYP
ncbi:hypothetical protein P261_00591 [Lachnospiraceae bacterium TWA4]|nr:hypothetical protein P261_00591 [Lachnospiraceae bacterium TWA4]